MNAETFEAWLEHHLLPTFGERGRHRVRARQSQGSQKPESGGNSAWSRKNCTVAHSHAALQRRTSTTIEMAISKLKSALRKAGRARRRPGLYRNLGELRRSLRSRPTAKAISRPAAIIPPSSSPRHNLNGFTLYASSRLLRYRIERYDAAHGLDTPLKDQPRPRTAGSKTRRNQIRMARLESSQAFPGYRHSFPDAGPKALAVVRRDRVCKPQG